MSETMEIVDRRRRTVALDEAALTGMEPEEAEGAQIAEADRVYDEPMPIFDRILIRQGAKETIWGGTKLVIPEVAQKAPNMGVVVACARSYIVNGVSFPMAELVSPGDLVTFSQFNTEEIQRDGETYVLCSIFDVKLIERVHFALGVSNAAGV